MIGHKEHFHYIYIYIYIYKSIRTSIVKDNYHTVWIGGIVLFCSGQELPVYPCSLNECRESRDNPLGKQNRTIINVLQISYMFNN